MAVVDCAPLETLTAILILCAPGVLNPFCRIRQRLCGRGAGRNAKTERDRIPVSDGLL